MGKKSKAVNRETMHKVYYLIQKLKGCDLRKFM